MTALIQDPSLQNERNPFSNVTLERNGARQGKAGGGVGENKMKKDEHWEKMEGVF